MKRGLQLQTKGFRPRKDQVEKIARIMETDPELDWSYVIRRGIDLFIAERNGKPLTRSHEAERSQLEKQATQLETEIQALKKSIERLSHNAERFD